MNQMKKLLPALIITLSCSFCLSNVTIAQDNGELLIDQWLLLGPLPISPTIFAEGDEIESWLNQAFLHLDEITPSEKDEIHWSPGVKSEWRKLEGEEITVPETVKYPAIAYIAAYITTGRRQTVSIKIETPYPSALFVDGANEAQITEIAAEDAPNLLSADCDLHNGKHLLMIKTVKPNDSPDPPWTINASIAPQEGFSIKTISLSLTPKRAFTNYHDYAKLERISGLVISPDGKKSAVLRSRREPETFKSHKWIEIFSTSDARLLKQIEFGKSISHPLFTRNSQSLFFRSSTSDGSILWLCDLKTGASEQILGPIKQLVKLLISPDEKFAVYTTDGERKSPGTDDYTLLTNLEQRLTDWKDKRRIFIASLEDGTTHQLSNTGDFALDEIALSPDGTKLVFTRRIPIAGSPYFNTEFWLIDLETGENRLLQNRKIPFETRPLNLTFLPDGEHLAFTCASHFTGESEEDSVHNLSETDIWLLNLNTMELKNLTGDTPFTVDEHGGTYNSLHWNPWDKRLYFSVMIRGFNKVYSIDIHHPADIREVPIPHLYIKHLHLSADGKKLVFTSQELDKSERAFAFDIKRGKQRSLLDPNADLMSDFTLGEYERWDFTDSLGHLIDGWIFYPPDFDESKKYPLIVYYYAGVWHLDESFYFTYHFWAANGYVVYALTPVGAMAHGDEFSDYHVNDWGEFATRDIIEGVNKLISEKDFINSDRMGCYGGSYGGFTTMDLVTKTDMFACAVSMYGISNIASYWGGGIWGYTYGDIALAKSYPWNRPDIFADKSPLFHADKITTPLLLLHGEADMNVPSLESEQMFTALKVLNRDVAYVKFPSEGHGIAGNFKNYAAHREMMLEWFDKYLKGQGEGWERRWE
ncbi:MAG: S9 family peptidase [candidate division Zixibacteria bacterium]|nr:S9 family peptidase [Candidatus Tariuqbacter arcticus]